MTELALKPDLIPKTVGSTAVHVCLRNDDKWFYNVGTAFVMKVRGERKNENKGLKLYCNMIIALADNARIRVKQKHECPSS